jgi:metal-dependent HD superfamily phosphatase/phosphodiesterase
MNLAQSIESAEEKYMLLIACYLHDLGMSVDREVVLVLFQVAAAISADLCLRKFLI